MSVNNIVSKEEFDRDLANTEHELNAYCMIADGFDMLMQMPENSRETNATYHQMMQHYIRLAGGCRDFLLKLKGHGEAMGYIAPLTQADLTFPEMTPDVLTITEE